MDQEKIEKARHHARLMLENKDEEQLPFWAQFEAFCADFHKGETSPYSEHCVEMGKILGEEYAKLA